MICKETQTCMCLIPRTRVTDSQTCRGTLFQCGKFPGLDPMDKIPLCNVFPRDIQNRCAGLFDLRRRIAGRYGLISQYADYNLANDFLNLLTIHAFLL